jgi:hypothetical protein
MMGWLGSIPQIEKVIWAQPLGREWTIAAVAAVVLLTVLLFWQSRGLPVLWRIALGVGRLLALLLAVGILFDPVAVLTRQKSVKRRLPVLIDVSESMSVQDKRKRAEDVVEAAVSLGMLPCAARRPRFPPSSLRPLAAPRGWNWRPAS